MNMWIIFLLVEMTGIIQQFLDISMNNALLKFNVYHLRTPEDYSDFKIYRGGENIPPHIVKRETFPFQENFHRPSSVEGYYETIFINHQPESCTKQQSILPNAGVETSPNIKQAMVRSNACGGSLGIISALALGSSSLLDIQQASQIQQTCPWRKRLQYFQTGGFQTLFLN